MAPGRLSAAPREPRGGGHASPARPPGGGRKMPVPGAAALPAAPLLVAEGPPAPDRGGRGRPPPQSGVLLPCPSVSVVFPGAVSRESCCRFAGELLKHVLHQRHQLPLPYEQLAFFCRRPAPEGDARKKAASVDLASKRCQQTLMDLEGLLQHLEAMFSLTPVPRVLFLLGGTVMSPRELYELNLEGVCEGSAEESLETASCVRKLFHSLFVADVFSELQALPATDTVVMLQGRRDCGVDWFWPKLNYKVPTRGKKLTVTLSCGGEMHLSASSPQHVASTWEDYIWFQAPVMLKGFQE
ncbi:MAD2L1-binding protein-like [Apus apus]|uniref:MAD2L1-binding protein-like n=1 Tax=Apus apus TaxID=8895 RepID=UPI0021F8DEBE|nr:MAD2L1-binding protein-like [Apus apus]